MNIPTSQRINYLAARNVGISCVVPVHNEEANVVEFIKELQAKLQQHTDKFEIILIDDGSEDATAQHIQQLNNPYVRLIQFSRNFGKENAIAAGLKHSSQDVTIIIDADFQHPFNLIDKFIKQWGQGYDMAYGVRENRADESIFKRWFTSLFYKTLKAITRIKIPPNAGDFRLMDRKVVDSLNTCEERTRFMKGLYAWVGYKSIGIPFQPDKRRAGKSSWRYSKLTELALTGFTAFSDIPLRVWTLTGFLIALLSFCIAIYIIASTLIYGVETPGYATIIVAVIFFGGIQLFSIGILGEYVSRIFQEVKQRPPYIIAQVHSFTKDKQEPAAVQEKHYDEQSIN